MITVDTLAAVFLSFGIAALILPFLIPFLIRLKVGQTERKEGVQVHLKKAGIPTMGGIAILVSVLIVSLVFAARYPRILPVLVLTLGFGIIGCVLEKVTGTSIRSLFQDQLFSPLDMRATLDASTLRDDEIMPVTRILPYHPGHDVRKTALGKRPLDTPDPERHFGHTAGAMYTDAVSVEKLLSCIRTGTGASGTYLPDSLVEEMHRVHAVYGRRSPTLSYGLGLLFVQDPRLSPHRFLGHQGLAYGCVDGAFWEEHTGRTMIFLNGGCSEGRVGMLTCSNRDLISFACREMNRWPS